MEFGLSPATLSTVRAILARHPAVESAILYGSRAKGNFKPGSDIDLTLTGSALDYAELTSIQEELYESDIPYQVDLSILANLNHPGLEEHIGRVGVVFYQRADAGEAPVIPGGLANNGAMQ